MDGIRTAGTVSPMSRPSTPTAGRWDLARATAIASAAAYEHSLPGPIELVRLAHTAVFRVGDVALKVIPATHSTHADVVAEARLVTYLHDAGIPVPTPVWTCHGGDDFTVTASEFVAHTRGALMPWGALGEAVAGLHAVAVPDFIPPWTDRRPVYLQRLADLVGSGMLSPGQADQLVGQLAPIPASTTPAVVNHGDLNSGNILVGAGQLTLVDWELARAAGPVMDLSGIANRGHRYGASARDLDDFCAGYGVADLESLPGSAAWGASQDLNGITYLLGCPGAAHRQEGQRRLCDVLAGTSSVWVAM